MLIQLLLLSCTNDKTSTDTGETPVIADIYPNVLGDAVPFMDASLLESYENGKNIMQHAFATDQGLGPTFNADSCASCHQKPISGGSAPRYRDFWLVKAERWDGALVNAGSNGQSPVRNLYATPPTYHASIYAIPADGSQAPDIALYARRNTPSMFGIGLFAFIADTDILANIDPDDIDGDGISGRANYEKGSVGRFGYKSQAATLESFNRGAMFNQMGITSDPLFYEFLEWQEFNAASSVRPIYTPLLPSLLDSTWKTLIQSADAQVSALDEPTIDFDDAPDPEMATSDQRDLLVFSTYLAPPTPVSVEDRSPREALGYELFSAIGCTKCHIENMPSIIGELPIYSDLLLHDMGEELADGIKVGFAGADEFRTAPLWGVTLHSPYMHDGRANTVEESIEFHAGEAQSTRDNWLALERSEKDAILAFLASLGGGVESNNDFTRSAAYQVPVYGEWGGPGRELSLEEQEAFAQGLELFDSSINREQGLNPLFNADSCRACHQDPVIGGAGGIDVNVLRIGTRNDTGFHTGSQTVLPRVADTLTLPDEIDDTINVIEARQPPSLLGLGLVDNISPETILSHEDPMDVNGDGISGVARILADGRLGRFGWKAQIPTVRDFIADAMLQEIGLTLDASLSDFTVATDDDICPDPEMPTDSFETLWFFIKELAPPLSTITEVLPLFVDVGCASCHIPEMDGVSLYSDLLLHDMGADMNHLVEQDEDVQATEFRTAPLWGITHTAPYLHDGSAPTLHKAILAHQGEASHSVELFQSLSVEDQQRLLEFLEGL